MDQVGENTQNKPRATSNTKKQEGENTQNKAQPKPGRCKQNSQLQSKFSHQEGALTPASLRLSTPAPTGSGAQKAVTRLLTGCCASLDTAPPAFRECRAAKF